ncbi:MAG: acyl-CoA dehydrogenase family protein [Firmicutes bacterium]|nr:acyl-CoA dehydrogenase family protein [Bacillota bacterium]
MEFKLNEDQQMIHDLAKDFAESVLQPRIDEIEAGEMTEVSNGQKHPQLPHDIHQQLAECGFIGISFPEEYNGMGMGHVEQAIVIKELSRVSPSVGKCLDVYILGLEALDLYANHEQKMKYLPDLLSGRKIGAFGLTEPGAGTDASGQQTIAVKNENGDYVLNGSKCFITNGNVASTFVVFAMTDKSKGNHGISAFIVESTFPGFSTGKHEKKMGIRGSSTCDLVFEDCVVPKENLLGKEGEGFKIAMKTLDGGRIGIASQALGLAEGAINEAVKYTKERVQFGRRLSQFQNTQFQLADMHTRTQAAQYLVYAAACKKQNHEDYSMDAAMAKLFAAETASDVTRRAVQLFGGYGYTREYPVERMMRDAKITEIYEGTSEVQRMVVAKYLGVN